MNALECLLRAEKKGVKKGIGKTVYDREGNVRN